MPAGWGVDKGWRPGRADGARGNWCVPLAHSGFLVWPTITALGALPPTCTHYVTARGFSGLPLNGGMCQVLDVAETSARRARVSMESPSLKPAGASDHLGTRGRVGFSLWDAGQVS